MGTQLKLGKKVGYLRPNKCRYEWAKIVDINEHSTRLERKIQGQTYRFWEITRDILDYSKMLSSDCPNKTLIKL